MLKRGKLPKIDASQGSWMTISTTASHLEPCSFVSDRDLIVGETISVYNREFFLYDCDEFTKFYYERQYGISQLLNINIEEDPAPIPQVGRQGKARCSTRI